MRLRADFWHWGLSLFFTTSGTQKRAEGRSLQRAPRTGAGSCGHDAYLTHRYQKGRRLHGSPASAPPSAPACSPPCCVLLFHGETSESKRAARRGYKMRRGQLPARAGRECNQDQDLEVDRREGDAHANITSRISQCKGRGGTGGPSNTYD